MRTHKASQKQSSSVNNSLVSRPFVVQPKAEERKESPGTQRYKSQMPEFAIFNPAGEQSPVQAKLAIGAPGDKYEQEADRTAKLVVQRINGSAIARSTSEPSIQRRGGLEGGEASTDLESAINSARSGGQPLDAGLQAKMSTAMGADFSGVRVHTDAQSDQLNRSIQAKAFTTGQDVFFRQGEYQPGSRGGQELIAHELTHVVQQNGRGNTMQTQLFCSSQVQRNGDDKDKEPSEGSLRPALGKALWSNLYGSNWAAKGIFKMMNFAMYVEGQPLTKEHNAVLEDSLLKNDKGVLDTLIAENPYVMKSTGYTPIYLLGKYAVHKPLEFYLKHRKEE